PTAAFTRGVGEVSPDYVAFAANQAIDAIVEAWESRQACTLRVGSSDMSDFQFNRTRENGPCDTRMSVLFATASNGRPVAAAVNFHCHLNAHLDGDFRAISRDWSGEMVDQLEAHFPGLTAMFLQGTAGDIMLKPEFTSTE